MKSISPVVSIILLIVITVSMASVSYLWFSGLFSKFLSQTEKQARTFADIGLLEISYVAFDGFYDNFEDWGLSKWILKGAHPNSKYEIVNGSLKLWNEWGGCCDASCYYTSIHTSKQFDLPLVIDFVFKQDPLPQEEGIDPNCGTTGPAVIYGPNKAEVVITWNWTSNTGLGLRIGNSYTRYFNRIPKGWHLVIVNLTKNSICVWRDWNSTWVCYSGTIIFPGWIGLAGDTDNQGWKYTTADYIDWIMISKDGFPIILIVYNPSTKPINLNNTYIIINNCILPMIFDETFKTDKNFPIIYPNEQVTVRIRPIYKAKFCELKRENKICLVGKSKVCSTLEIP